MHRLGREPPHLNGIGKNPCRSIGKQSRIIARGPSLNPEHNAMHKWSCRAFFLLVGLFLIRLAYIAATPLDLIADEAYYWDWSRRPAMGYFSKPPMISWINGLSSWLLPHADFSVRLPSVLLGVAGNLALFLTARRMFDARIAFWALAAMVATPGAVALNFLMTIDSPLVCFWCCALYTFWRSREPGSSAYWWILTGVFIGLGVLSKQMMMVFPLLMFIFLVMHRPDRHHLRKAGPYLAALLGYLALLPPVIWNMRNDWVTIEHTAHHFERESAGLFDYLWQFLGSQLAVISPVTFVLLLMAGVVLTFRHWPWEAPTAFAYIFSMPAILVFILMSMRQEINPNWPAAYYPAGVVLLACWAKGAFPLGGFDRLRPVFSSGVWIGAVLVAVVYILPLVLSYSGLRGISGVDPMVRLTGWRAVATEVDEQLRQMPNPDDTFIITRDRGIAASLAFYLPGQPRTYRWPGMDGKVRTQYEIWPGPFPEQAGRDALIVARAEQPFFDGVFRYFEDVEHIGEIRRPLGESRFRVLVLYHGKNLTGWPR
jgi:hypothetical protein